ncbi:MAG: DUF2156 domain-containing protein [Thermoplasmatales archaeon]|nr:MAG: DUF2156 domain-containing protein [Thermoplasmatales archaeon]
MLLIEDFKPIKIEDKPIFDKYYKKYPPVHSDYVFTTLVSWMDYAKFCYMINNNNLIVASKINNKIQIKSPIGDKNKNIFDEVLKLAKQQESEYPFGVIDKNTKNWLENNYPNLELIPTRDYFDYVYNSTDLAELAGSNYSKIRNRLNKFKKNNEYSVESITEDNMKDIREFLKRWCLWKDCDKDPLLENEKKAILYSMENFFDLKLSGLSMIVNGDIEAISVFEKMSNDTAIVHYEKGSPDYDGIYKAINQETAKILQKDFKYINRESDMGVSGLRKAKLSYKPVFMIEVYTAIKNSI